jgi:hypothetical protein
MMTGSALMYLFNHQEVAEVFTRLGYPVYVIYPLAVAKLLGVTAITTRKVNTLTEWAYAGFFFDVLLALSAHVTAGDGEWQPALVASALVLTSYLAGGRPRS